MLDYTAQGFTRVGSAGPPIISTLPANQRVAWRALAIEIYRVHDSILNAAASTKREVRLAARRLRGALPKLTQMANDPLLEADDRAYVRDLIERLERPGRL